MGRVGIKSRGRDGERGLCLKEMREKSKRDEKGRVGGRG